MSLPAKIYTEKEVQRARRTSKVVGWIQGGGAVILAGIVFNMLGWIPTLAVAGGVGYVGYRILKWSSSDDDAET